MTSYRRPHAPPKGAMGWGGHAAAPRQVDVATWRPSVTAPHERLHPLPLGAPASTSTELHGCIAGEQRIAGDVVGV